MSDFFWGKVQSKNKSCGKHVFPRKWGVRLAQFKYVTNMGNTKNKQNRENHKLALSHVDCGCACCWGLAKPNQDMCLIFMLALCLLFPLIFFFGPSFLQKDCHLQHKACAWARAPAIRLVLGQGPSHTKTYTCLYVWPLLGQTKTCI